MLTVNLSDNTIELSFTSPDSVLVAVLEGREWTKGVYKDAVSATITNIISQYPPFTFDRVETVHHEPSRSGHHRLHSRVTMAFDEDQTELVKAGTRWLSWVMVYTSELAKGLQQHALAAKNTSN